MNKKNLAIFVLISGALISLFVCGCETMPFTEDKASQAGPASNIRISGDITEAVISRKGF